MLPYYPNKLQPWQITSTNLFMIGFKVNHTVHAFCLHGIGQWSIIIFYIYFWLAGFHKQLAI